MKLITIHQKTALWWLIASPGVFAPALANSQRQDAGAVLAWGVTTVAVMILGCPWLLRWHPITRWCGWTQKLSTRQRKAIAELQVRGYYRAALEDGYLERALPCVRRLMLTACGLLAASVSLPSDTGLAGWDALVIFVPWYPMGAAIVAVASLPHSRFLRG